MRVTASLSFKISPDSEVKVKKDDHLKRGDVIAIHEETRKTQDIDLAKAMKISGDKILKTLQKSIGQEVKKGEILAVYKKTLGNTIEAICPFDGVIESITDDGILRIAYEKEKTEISVPVDAKVEDITSDKVTVSFPAMEIKGKEGRGARRLGLLSGIDKDMADVLDLSCDHQGKILAVRGGFSRGFLFKALSLGVLGLVAGEVMEEAVAELIGGEDIPMVFWEGKIDDSVWKALTDFQGKEVLVEGEEKRILMPK